MEIKLNMMGFVFSFVFLIGMGQAIAHFNSHLIQLLLLLIAAIGYWLIIIVTKDLLKENQKMIDKKLLERGE